MEKIYEGKTKELDYCIAIKEVLSEMEGGVFRTVGTKGIDLPWGYKNSDDALLALTAAVASRLDRNGWILEDNQPPMEGIESVTHFPVDYRSVGRRFTLIAFNYLIVHEENNHENS